MRKSRSNKQPRNQTEKCTRIGIDIVARIRDAICKLMRSIRVPADGHGEDDVPGDYIDGDCDVHKPLQLVGHAYHKL